MTPNNNTQKLNIKFRTWILVINFIIKIGNRKLVKVQEKVQVRNKKVIKVRQKFKLIIKVMMKIHFLSSQMQLLSGHKSSIVKINKDVLLTSRIMIVLRYGFLIKRGKSLLLLWNNFGKLKVRISIKLSYSNWANFMNYSMTMQQLETNTSI